MKTKTRLRQLGKVKILKKQPKDESWIAQLLNERWGGGSRVIVHGEMFDARTLPATIAGFGTYVAGKANYFEGCNI